MVPERNAVDQCFKEAYEAAVSADTRALVYALEGVARQIRDADDTQSNGFDLLIKAINENNVTLTAGLDQLASVVNALDNPKKERRFLS